ncbi:Os04g0168683 [Oryza sativa Japonica Group]|uniref:Os04g0168683 protein n=1 Tax=Oryza sativa subsp. japonica TaxID=39947 RepID=A0A0P0W731_ORYSJ|nr:Os04g0168683 [Oryza sativa Japonica Group]
MSLKFPLLTPSFLPLLEIFSIRLCRRVRSITRVDEATITSASQPRLPDSTRQRGRTLAPSYILECLLLQGLVSSSSPPLEPPSSPDCRKLELTLWLPAAPPSASSTPCASVVELELCLLAARSTCSMLKLQGQVPLSLSPLELELADPTQENFDAGACLR